MPTTVTETFYVPGPGETPVPARGYVRWYPVAPGIVPGGTILPVPFRVALVNGAMTVSVEATGPGWVWAITEQFYGLVQRTRYYLVPNSATPVDLSTLTEVDLLSLQPTAQPDPGWYAYLDAIAAGQVGVVKVVTGTEARVNFGSVLWIGGSTQPVNMADGTDIWFKATT